MLTELEKKNMEIKKCIDHYLEQKYNESTREQIFIDVVYLFRNKYLRSLIIAVINQATLVINSGVKIDLVSFKTASSNISQTLPELRYNNTLEDILVIGELSENITGQNDTDKQKEFSRSLTNSWNYLSEPNFEFNDIQLIIN